MIRAFVLASTLLLASCATPAQKAEREIAEAEPVDAVLAQYGFEGEVAFSRDADTISRRQDGGADRIWPWASVTKQVVATMVMQDVVGGAIRLDAPMSDYLDWPTAFRAPTVRELLQHRSGLNNPDDVPGADGFPPIYREGLSKEFCLLEMSAPGGEFSHNNCDYVMLGALIEKVSGKPFGTLLRERIIVPADLKATGLARANTPIAGEGTSAEMLAAYGASGAMVGTALDLIAFDRGLLSGHLLSVDGRDVMWQGDPALGYAALGQSSFEAPLRGCEEPVRIVERRGGIGNYQSRNFILPDRDFAMVAFTDQRDIDFGEIWTGKGLSYDLLSAAAC